MSVKTRELRHRFKPRYGSCRAGWVRDLVKRLRNETDGEILHRLRGRASKRRIAEAVQEKVVRLVTRKYGDFDPAERVAAEYPAEKHHMRDYAAGAGKRRARGRIGEACDGR